MTQQLKLTPAQRARAEAFQRQFDDAKNNKSSMSLVDLQKLTQEYTEFLKQVSQSQ